MHKWKKPKIFKCWKCLKCGAEVSLLIGDPAPADDALLFYDPGGDEYDIVPPDRKYLTDDQLQYVTQTFTCEEAIIHRIQNA